MATQARACILSDNNIFYTPRGGRERRGNAPGAFLVTPPSGRGLVIPVFYPAVRTGSSNTLFFTPPSGRGLVIPVFLLSWSLAPDLRSVKTILPGNLGSFSVIFARIFMKVGVENCWRFNGMKTPSMKARTKVIERQKSIRGILLLSLKHLSNHGLKVDLYVSFFSR